MANIEIRNILTLKQTTVSQMIIMKKWMLLFILFVCFVIFSAYFFIPSQGIYNNSTVVGCTQSAAVRKITKKNALQMWWPGQKQGEYLYTYKKVQYRIDKTLMNGFETTAFEKSDSIKGILQFIYYGNDSMQIHWASTHRFSSNPIIKIMQYFSLKKYTNNIESLLKDLNKYFNVQENIYGIKIIKQKFGGSSMISLKYSTTHYPNTAEIYKMVDSIKAYIFKKGGAAENYPMIHVSSRDLGIFETMVALSTKTELAAEGKFELKKMPLGNMLIAEVRGGSYTIMRSEHELTNYITDYGKSSPAIPFQSLITNRLLETDTAKWITKLYYPIFK